MKISSGHNILTYFKLMRWWIWFIAAIVLELADILDFPSDLNKDDEISFAYWNWQS